MTDLDEALRRAQMLTISDIEVIAAVDAKALKGVVRKSETMQTVGYVSAGDLEDWKRTAGYGTDAL